MSDAAAAIPDWERIEADYRAGVLSLREIAAPHGVSEGAIRKRAKRDGWSRDLAAKIQAKADELVRREAVREEVRKVRIATERELIEANAERIAQVRGEHRADIARFRTLALALLKELEGESEACEGDNAAAEVSDGVEGIALPQRIKSLKELSDALAKLVALEREAYGIAAVEVQKSDAKPLSAFYGQ